MIFVTVGTHTQGFERLIKKMDEIALNTDEEVIMQIGYTKFRPQNAIWFKFKEIEEIYKLYKDADIVVAHAGAGTLLDALFFQKNIIVVPRFKKYGEHIDNQQIELAEALKKSGHVLVVYDIENLNSIIKKPIKSKKRSINENINLSYYIKEFLRGNLL